MWEDSSLRSGNSAYRRGFFFYIEPRDAGPLRRKPGLLDSSDTAKRACGGWLFYAGLFVSLCNSVYVLCQERIGSLLVQVRAAREQLFDAAGLQRPRNRAASCG